MTDINPYQPPAPIDDLPGADEAQSEARSEARSEAISSVFPFGMAVGQLRAIDAESAADVLSGQAVVEYGVIFRVADSNPDRIFAAIPMTVDDPEHRELSAVEAACVLQELIARLDGLGPHIIDRSLVVSMVPNYALINSETYQVVLPPDYWTTCRRSDG